jgi:hypothetical protein
MAFPKTRQNGNYTPRWWRMQPQIQATTRPIAVARDVCRCDGGDFYHRTPARVFDPAHARGPVPAPTRDPLADALRADVPLVELRLRRRPLARGGDRWRRCGAAGSRNTAIEGSMTRRKTSKADYKSLKSRRSYPRAPAHQWSGRDPHRSHEAEGTLM